MTSHRVREIELSDLILALDEISEFLDDMRAEDEASVCREPMSLHYPATDASQPPAKSFQAKQETKATPSRASSRQRPYFVAPYLASGARPR